MGKQADGIESRDGQGGIKEDPGHVCDMLNLQPRP